MKVFSILLMVFTILNGQNGEVSFMRFYATDHDYLSDNRLLATDRFERPHLQVFYNDRKLAVMKEWINADGESINQEVLQYSKENKLIRRYFLDADQKPDSLIQYGVDEPWSEEFRKETPKQIQGYYEGQASKFILNESDQIESIHFTDVRGDHYGKIDFIYDHLGLLNGELWISLPTEKTIRRFAYSIDMLTNRKEIWEFDHRGQEVSHVALVKPLADQLYKTPPPRYGNRLDEISIILEEIREKDLTVPFDVFIPKTDYDLMVLTNGDSLLIHVVELGKQRVTFIIIGEKGELTMPKYRVQSITTKYGEQIFP
ncbi:MAG: hypothetical protein HOE72_04170 [Candidatus Marinimicrobia bacterium]|jgi:hypothetical protein|nr:hypothetical protein [Candidatus Neomarinimicrobiota bacterium]MBT5386616.1 hypothetical protein [Candidatus Neomarinimicrobiota bacterium]MCP4931527.1 hypothetical protein [Candidatus Neomarinimicrobiota bacterium]MDP6201074.1 hypothetical protein [Candidatus Neomarinimicrobiota bacterium]HCI16912.1 hypothetical protein [Candidatus Neomarinimicrobiota bacterium]